MKNGTVVVIANQKGGVGKSTTAHILRDEFSKTLCLKILLIDYDAQGSLTNLLDIDKELIKSVNASGSICNIFERKEVNIIEYSENIDVIVSDPLLNDSFYSAKSGKELMLKKYLEKVKHDYDLVLIDTKPDLGVPLVSAIIAADIIINPISTGGIEEEATVTFYDKVEEIVDIYDVNIKKIFVIPTMLDQARDSKDAYHSIKHDLPDLYEKRYKSLSSKTPMVVLKAVPRRAVIKNATGVKVPLRQYIEEFDTGKKDVLLDLEKMAKKIWKGARE